uniref:Lipid scramblase CLPTM1L n=1 Tax=Macrostomum lignano TaxID=282301 RepID=A0A1I8F562_9PLAT
FSRRRLPANLSASRLSFKEADLVQVNSTDTRACCHPPLRAPSGSFASLQTLELSVESLKSFGFRDTDIDDVKAIFNDTNFYLLLLTIFVSVFHLVFDFLAFKNDIASGGQMDRSVGISSTAVFVALHQRLCGAACTLAEEKTSLLVVAPAACAARHRTVEIVQGVSISFRGLAWAPRSEAERKTGALDSQGTRYLSYVMLLPLCAGAPIYSLMYVPHKSWYSWTINSMANCVYAFGFLFMTPQLFINYKMKSVAHLPWKALTYKPSIPSLTTCLLLLSECPPRTGWPAFRDDVIFIIYMYQRWLYPVDKSRTNEFGQSFDEAEPSSGDAGDKSRDPPRGSSAAAPASPRPLLERRRSGGRRHPGGDGLARQPGQRRSLQQPPKPPLRLAPLRPACAGSVAEFSCSSSSNSRHTSDGRISPTAVTTAPTLKTPRATYFSTLARSGSTPALDSGQLNELRLVRQEEGDGEAEGAEDQAVDADPQHRLPHDRPQVAAPPLLAAASAAARQQASHLVAGIDGGRIGWRRRALVKGAASASAAAAAVELVQVGFHLGASAAAGAWRPRRSLRQLREQLRPLQAPPKQANGFEAEARDSSIPCLLPQ